MNSIVIGGISIIAIELLKRSGPAPTTPVTSGGVGPGQVPDTVDPDGTAEFCGVVRVGLPDRNPQFFSMETGLEITAEQADEIERQMGCRGVL